MANHTQYYLFKNKECKIEIRLGIPALQISDLERWQYGRKQNKTKQINQTNKPTTTKNHNQNTHTQTNPNKTQQQTDKQETQTSKQTKNQNKNKQT